MLEESQQTPASPTSETPVVPSEPIAPQPPKRSKKRLIILMTVLVLLLVGCGVWYVVHKKDNNAPSKSPQSSTPKKTVTSVPGLQLDTRKDYGDKYADGIVPVGDGHYTTDSAKHAYVYLCNANFVPAGQAGAQTRGSWFVNNNTAYDLNKKVHVNGSVSWTPSLSNAITGSNRVISTNDLPSHVTGVFPVSSSDAAYAYDRNPNSIKAQELTYNLAAQPTYGTPHCMGGEVGVMLTGVALFNAFDAGGRDAGAWEVQDDCDGHPQSKGEYHYHSLSRCITDISVGKVIGFALDGFPITGPKVGDHNILTTSDLDECHGIVSEVTLDGKKVTTYHYVMTQDFPYSASCFRSAPISAPGLKENDGSSNTPKNGQQQPRLDPARP